MDPAINFELKRKQAKLLLEAEAAGQPTDTKEFDFRTIPVCLGCMKPIFTGKAFTCSGCKAVTYCSQACLLKSWKTPLVPNAPTHRQLCPDNKRHMEKLPETNAILLQFPWSRLEKDGHFDLDIARARFGVLGEDGYGYWSHRAGNRPDLPDAEPDAMNAQIHAGEDTFGKLADKMWARSGYIDGSMLLDRSHLCDSEGWRLEKDELMPFIYFDADHPPPKLVTDPEVQEMKDWDAWYKWRNLPKQSPAALLMTFPLSVYWLLVHVLKITHPTKVTSFDGPHIKLVIHYVGAEVELNFLPLFAELALLLPHHDITLVVFGPAIRNLMRRVPYSPDSLAAKASSTVPIFTYTAPKECGASSISIFLHVSAPYWTPADALTYGGQLDAIVAANAGLDTTSWEPVTVWTQATNTPFAITEYAEQSCEISRFNFKRTLADAVMKPGTLFKSSVGVPSQRELMNSAMKKRDYIIELNPFQQPGQRPLVAHRLPNTSNGFTMRVVGKDG